MQTKELPESLIPHSREMEEALGVLDVLKETGLALVPPDPTDEMVMAGMVASGASAEQTRAVYIAMLASAAKEGIEG
jgi:hypothetical protein